MGGKKDGFGCGGGCGGLRIGGGGAGAGGFVIDFSKCFFMSKRRR